MSGKQRKPTSVLFVCTGNICRSPLAEVLLRDYTEKQGKGRLLAVSSAGTHAWDGNPATGEAREAARRWGLDLAGHRSRELRRSIMDAADVVLAMTRRHHEHLVQAFPESKNKIYLALLYPRGLEGQTTAGAEVPDPIGESVGFYLDVLQMLEPALPKILSGALGEETI